MTRAIVISALVAICVLSARMGESQGQAANTPPIRMKTLETLDILYALMGGGANSLALMHDSGVVLINTKQSGLGRALTETIQTVAAAPVTTIINTSADADHTGNNGEFPNATQIIAHPNTKAAMEKMDAFKGPNAKFLPNKMITDRLTLLDGFDQVDVYYFGRGHTDGDLVVVFPNKQQSFGGSSPVAYFGDLFPSKAAPVIDTAHGGSAVALADTLTKAVEALKGLNVKRVVTGHDPMSDRPGNYSLYPPTKNWKDVEEYAEFNRDFLAAVRTAMSEGKTVAQAAETLQLPERYKSYDMQQAKANVEKIYRELGK